LTSFSQGLKAGLAAGAIYAAIIGLLHFSTLLGCSSAQISFIAQRIPASSNSSASEIFYGTDIIYYPMVYGVSTLIIGVIFGGIFGFLYSRLPGTASKTKGLGLGVAVFFVVAFVGPGFLLTYSCGGSLFPYFTFVLSIPSALLFGYLLGSFYDSFGRLEREETDQRKQLEHWSDLLKRKPQQEKNEHQKTTSNIVSERLGCADDETFTHFSRRRRRLYHYP
jgi:hypothetical protein